MANLTKQEWKLAAKCWLQRKFIKGKCSYPEFEEHFFEHKDENFATLLYKSKAIVKEIPLAKLKECYDSGLSLYETIMSLVIMDPDIEQEIARIIDQEYPLDADEYSEEFLVLASAFTKFYLSDRPPLSLLQENSLRNFLIYLYNPAYFSGSIALNVKELYEFGNSDKITLKLSNNDLIISESFVARDAVITEQHGTTYYRSISRYQTVPENENTSPYLEIEKYEDQAELRSIFSNLSCMVSLECLHINDELKILKKGKVRTANKVFLDSGPSTCRKPLINSGKIKISEMKLPAAEQRGI